MEHKPNYQIVAVIIMAIITIGIFASVIIKLETTKETQYTIKQEVNPNGVIDYIDSNVVKRNIEMKKNYTRNLENAKNEYVKALEKTKGELTTPGDVTHLILTKNIFEQFILASPISSDPNRTRIDTTIITYIYKKDKIQHRSEVPYKKGVPKAQKAIADSLIKVYKHQDENLKAIEEEIGNPLTIDYAR